MLETLEAIVQFNHLNIIYPVIQPRASCNTRTIHRNQFSLLGFRWFISDSLIVESVRRERDDPITHHRNPSEKTCVCAASRSRQNTERRTDRSTVIFLLIPTNPSELGFDRPQKQNTRKKINPTSEGWISSRADSGYDEGEGRIDSSVKGEAGRRGRLAHLGTEEPRRVWICSRSLPPVALAFRE